MFGRQVQCEHSSWTLTAADFAEPMVLYNVGIGTICNCALDNTRAACHACPTHGLVSVRRPGKQRGFQATSECFAAAEETSNMLCVEELDDNIKNFGYELFHGFELSTEYV